MNRKRAGLLRSAGGNADCVIDPDRPGHHLSVEPDGDAGFVAFADEPPLRPPIPLAAEDVDWLVPDWTTISEALGRSLKITPGPLPTALAALLHPAPLARPQPRRSAHPEAARAGQILRATCRQSRPVRMIVESVGAGSI